MTRPELEAEFRRLLARYAGPVPEELVLGLLGAASEDKAEAIERACRPYPWPPVRRREHGEAQGMRREKREERSA